MKEQIKAHARTPSSGSRPCCVTCALTDGSRARPRERLGRSFELGELCGGGVRVASALLGRLARFLGGLLRLVGGLLSSLRSFIQLTRPLLEPAALALSLGLLLATLG
jgi:hypothetical protein